MKKLLLSLIFLFGLQVINFAQVNITSNNNAATLAQTLVGTGVTITNPTLDCGVVNGNSGAGLFNVVSSNLGLDSGILLTTGVAATNGGFEGANFPVNGPPAVVSTVTANGGDPDLGLLINGNTFDKCILEFDFVTTGDSVKFDYVFGSEEYHNYTCTNFNDVFGFFLSGPGIVGQCPYRTKRGTVFIQIV